MSKYPAEFETETHEKYHYKKRKHKVVRSICSLHTFSEFQAKTKYILFYFKCLEYHIYVVSMRIHESGIISTYIHSQEKIRFVHVLFVQKISTYLCSVLHSNTPLQRKAERLFTQPKIVKILEFVMGSTDISLAFSRYDHVLKQHLRGSQSQIKLNFVACYSATLERMSG